MSASHVGRASDDRCMLGGVVRRDFRSAVGAEEGNFAKTARYSASDGDALRE